MLSRSKKLSLFTERLQLRLPEKSDYAAWSRLRGMSENFLKPWEPSWAPYHLSRGDFDQRVALARKSFEGGTAIPLLILRQRDQFLVGGIALENIRLGPSQSATVGYWTGKPFVRNGYMKEALSAVVHYAFAEIGLSRIEAACLPMNKPSRRLLESSGFKYEGVAQSYLEIDGRWRNHVLYANLRKDRRGRAGYD